MLWTSLRGYMYQKLSLHFSFNTNFSFQQLCSNDTSQLSTVHIPLVHAAHHRRLLTSLGPTKCCYIYAIDDDGNLLARESPTVIYETADPHPASLLKISLLREPYSSPFPPAANYSSLLDTRPDNQNYSTISTLLWLRGIILGIQQLFSHLLTSD